ncbi:MAG: ISAs1 family transposase [Saprospiraceae bacterium]|nr:ISAs1 family transposase [Saprospiraceae bacterium]
MKELSHELEQRNSFYLALQNSNAIDLRDKRGKVLNMSLVLCGLICSLLRGRDGSLCSLHRGMKQKQSALCSTLGIEYEPVVSRSHLPVLLKKVDFNALGDLVFEHFGVDLGSDDKTWLALDGKELRGSILLGYTRGEAIVQVVRHEDRKVHRQLYYNGSKQSERPVVDKALKCDILARQKLSFDALHFTPSVLGRIAQASGIYLGGLKGNQSEVFTDMEQASKRLKASFELYSKEKGHGREETRHYKAIHIKGEYFDKRWNEAAFETLIQVKRTRLENKRAKYSEETSYYMSNEKVTTQEQADGLFNAVRTHWAIETNNHIRDVSFKEDALKSIKNEVALTTSVLRTLVTNILKFINPKNIVAQLDDFAENFNELTAFLQKVNFL